MRAMASPPPDDTLPHAWPERLLAARVRARRAAGGSLPLAVTGARGEPLRWRVREEEGEARAALLLRWREALAALHGAGFGTDGVLAASLLLRGGRIAFDPDRVWPLGARPAPDEGGDAGGERPTLARPIAAWLDVREVAGWLDAAGHDAPHPFEDGAAPLSAGAPEDPADGGVRLVVGPVAETLAIAAVLGLGAVVAGDSSADAAAEATRALAGGGTVLVAAPRGEATELPRWLIAASRAHLACHGGPPPLTDEDAALLGVARPPGGLARPDAESYGPASEGELELRRRLEASDLIAEPAARHKARAALTARIAHPDLDAGRRNREAAVALARTSGDRQLLADALLGRAMGGYVFDAEAALKDATEARRLAAALGDRERGALGAALEQLLARLEGGRAPAADAAAIDGRARGHVAMALDAVRRWATGGSGASAARALNLAALVGREEVLAMVAELATWRALAEGRELAMERLLGAVVAAQRLSGGGTGAASMARALGALLAARRGAELTSTDHLVALGDTPRLPTRVGAIGAIAARAAGLDALAARLAHAAGDTCTPARLFAVAPPPGDPEAGVLTLFAELLVGRPEAEIRRHLPLLEGRAAAWLDAPRETAVPVGLLVAVGTALATLGERRAEAPLSRALATSDLEEVVELRALGALAWVLPESTDEGRAVAARLAAKATLRPRAGTPAGPSAPPPISAREAVERVVAAVEAWSTATRGAAGGERPVAGLERLLGRSFGASPEGLNALEGPLDVREEASGGVTLTIAAGTPNARPLRFEGPLSLPPDAMERLLAALLPLATGAAPRKADAEAPDPGIALDAALSAGALDFMAEVRPRFARHELTRETIRAAVGLALARTGGLYKAVAARWGIKDYQRFMDFLRRNGCLVDFRPFRTGTRARTAGPAKTPARPKPRSRER